MTKFLEKQGKRVFTELAAMMLHEIDQEPGEVSV
jgi:hypothetical protein